MKNQECLLDTLIIEKCLEKLSNTDKCAACIDGYFLSKDGYSCLKNPEGIPYCRIYED